MVVDYSMPLIAINLRGGKPIPVSINTKYSTKSGAPVKMPRNAWTGDHDGGTWYFNDAGQAIGGLSEDGYNGRYIVRNAEPEGVGQSL